MCVPYLQIYKKVKPLMDALEAAQAAKAAAIADLAKVYTRVCWLHILLEALAKTTGVAVETAHSAEDRS